MPSGIVEDEIIHSYGLPHPDWERVNARLMELPEIEHTTAYRSVVAQWLEMLRAAFGDEATVNRSERIFMLSTRHDDEGARLLDWANLALCRLETMLGDMQEAERYGPRVILLMPDQDRLYDYLSAHYDDGRYGGASGCAVTGGYLHIVVGPAEFGERQRIIAHELTHVCLFGRELPLWLEEGLAQEVEDVTTGYSYFTLDREMRDRHQRLWRRCGLGQFWSGNSFYKTGWAQRLSYNLAQVLVRNMIGDHRQAFVQFAKEAHWSDAGDTAARQLFGRGLGEIAAAFLGEGDWEPNAERIAHDAARYAL